MLFAEGWLNVLVIMFLVGCLLLWGVVKLLNKIDPDGMVKKAAKEKIISTLMRWLS